MIVSEGSILTFLQKIKDHNGKELVCFKRKLLFKPGTMHKKVYAAINGQALDKTIQLVIQKSEIVDYSPDKLVTISKYAFQPNIKFKKGMLLKAFHNQQPVLAHIHRVDAETVTLDLNAYHSILGQDVIYEVTILEIETPSTDAQSTPPTEHRELILNNKPYIILN